MVIYSHSKDFYPRPPRGGRQQLDCQLAIVIYFYPRPPRGGRQQHIGGVLSAGIISIHALREEGDLVIKVFAPRTDISIHALREEGDSGS